MSDDRMAQIRLSRAEAAFLQSLLRHWQKTSYYGDNPEESAMAERLRQTFVEAEALLAKEEAKP